jgi:hypothetical protein
MNFSKESSTFVNMIREAIIQELSRRNLSKRKCAIDAGIGEDYRHFNEFLLGERNYPIEKIEKVLLHLDLEIKNKDYF